ncbi:MAG: hypothetical protein LUO95_11705 [Methylococcaceae bacterium]|nr:hypothetical protein [Methylococcaceae bacterium]
MKKIICVLAVVTFISGCNSNTLLEKKESNEKITNVIQIRNEIAFLPNENEPFTGKYEEYYSNGKKKYEANYKYGKLNGLKRQGGMKTVRKNIMQTIKTGRKMDYR